MLRMKRDVAIVRRDAAEMRRAIAAEKGETDRWDFKNAAGGLIDIEFIAQYLQLTHAASRPEILDTNTGRVLAQARSLGLLDTADSEHLRGAWQLYTDLGQILRLCLSQPFDPKQVGPGLLTLLARAAGLPDFTTLDAHLIDTQKRVRGCFKRLLERASQFDPERTLTLCDRTSQSIQVSRYDAMGWRSMSGLAFSSDAAETLVAAYRTPDMVRQRDATLQRLHLKPGERVIDIGCGPGFLCKSMAAAVGPTGRVVGIDISEDLIDFATKSQR